MGVTLTGTLRCKTPEEAARVRAALPAHVALTRAEPGCVSFDVTPTDDPIIWTVAEEFTDPAAFDAHQARAAASDWARETAGIERDYVVKGMP
ncbi:putative quinol monooxygenase [uncultured Tateyamaria sp.]|uniref:putative quinol monooxygenase n=1 Tax=uncultured Tateyamaria sp. TaxID=455651 RepID=UPI00261F8160|nr:putative quinol monooxygenase [uncultured Tateyamaria sp.]